MCDHQQERPAWTVAVAAATRRGGVFASPCGAGWAQDEGNDLGGGEGGPRVVSACVTCYFFVPPTGFEPVTPALGERCSIP